MTKYKLTFTKEKDGIIDKDFTMKAEYMLSDETVFNFDPESFVVKHLTEMLLEHFSKFKEDDFTTDAEIIERLIKIPHEYLWKAEDIRKGGL